MRARWRPRLLSRPAKVAGRKRIKEASALLSQRVPGGTERKSGVGGARQYPVKWTAPRRRSVDGFLDVTPDPPKTRGKNSKRLSLDDRDAVGRGGAAVMEAEAQRAETAAVPVRASRAGAPTAPHNMTYTRQDGCWMSRKAYRRLWNGRQRAEQQLKEARAQLMRLLRKPPLEVRLATGALLQSVGGVSASKVPYVLALTSRYHIGRVALEHQFATSTALEYARTAGVCLKQRLIQLIGSTKAPFCVGTDTSSRACLARCAPTGSPHIGARSAPGRVAKAGHGRPAPGGRQSHRRGSEDQGTLARRGGTSESSS